MTRLEELISKSQNGDSRAKELLIEENSGLIWSVVKRFIGRGTEPDDLYQLGCLGFLKAVEGFDLSYGTQFSTYAVPKVSGEIRRFLRDDGAIKVSRSLKERALVIKSAQNLLSQRLSRDPTMQELSEQTGLTAEEIAAAVSATADVESIHQQTGDEGFTLENVLSNSRGEEEMLESICLREAIARLPHREAMVIRLRYYHSLTQERVAKVLHVSQVQVSRIEKKALENLRQYLK